MSVYANGSPTVTIFADHGPLVTRIGDELLARGASTHTVSVESGWLESASRAVVDMDSQAGRSAARDLCDRPAVPTRVVALLPEGMDIDTEDLCDKCRDRHDLVVLSASQTDVVDRVAEEVVGPNPN